MISERSKAELTGVVIIEITIIPHPPTPDRSHMLLHAMSADNGDTSDETIPESLELSLSADNRDMLGGTVLYSPG